MKTRLEALGPKAAVVLFQLPPQFGKDEPRLRAFLTRNGGGRAWLVLLQ